MVLATVQMGQSRLNDLLNIKVEKLLVWLIAVLIAFMPRLCYHSVQKLLSSGLLSKNLKVKIL